MRQMMVGLMAGALVAGVGLTAQESVALEEVSPSCLVTKNKREARRFSGQRKIVHVAVCFARDGAAIRSVAWGVTRRGRIRCVQHGIAASDTATIRWATHACGIPDF